MKTLVDNIESFRVGPKDLNIPFEEFEGKLAFLRPIKCGTAIGDILWCSPNGGGLKFRTQEEFKQRLSDLIKEHVISFTEIRWNE